MDFLLHNSAWATIVARLHEMLKSALAMLPNLVAGVIVFLLFFVAGKLFRRSVHRVLRGHQRYSNLEKVLGRLGKGTIWIVGLLVAATIVLPNFTPASLIQLLGISSVAIGFAFRDVLQNYLSGILLLLTEPFRIGDQIIFKDFEGTVEDIQTRATYVRTYDGRRVVVPNGELFTNTVTVNTAFDTRRVEYDVGIGYGDDIELATRLILDTLKQLPETLEDPAPEVLAYDLAASTVVLRVRWWIHPPVRSDVLRSRDAVIRRVKAILTENGIDLPFPTQQILFHDQTEESDGDRKRQREGWPAGKGHVPRPLRLVRAHQNGDGKRHEAARAEER